MKIITLIIENAYTGENKLSLKNKRIGVYTSIYDLLNNFNQLEIVIEENEPKYIFQNPIETEL